MGSKTKFSASISIRSLVKRETTGYRWLGDETKDFNPLPRKEGDYNIDDVNETYSISIRSLVKRETIRLYRRICNKMISIRSLVKRETNDKATYQGLVWISIRSLVKRETANFAKIWLNRILILCTFLLEHKKFWFNAKNSFICKLYLTKFY